MPNLEAPTLDQQAAAAWALYDAADTMRNIARDSFLDVYRYPEIAAPARLAVRSMVDQPITGHIDVNQFYGFHPRDTIKYQPEIVNLRNYHEMDFRGVFKRLVNIEVPVLRGRMTRRLCLQVAPFSKQPDENWAAFYRDNDMVDQYNHPFARPTLAEKTVCLPVDSLTRGLLFFPSTPRDSKAVIRRDVYSRPSGA